MRVLHIYHSAVVREFRQRERMLRARHGCSLKLTFASNGTSTGSTGTMTMPPQISTLLAPTSTNSSSSSPAVGFLTVQLTNGTTLTGTVLAQ